MTAKFLNIFFFVFHTSIILFNLFGWLWRRTRKWNLAALSLTALSWFGLGIWYGIGFCPCTQWHWQIRTQLGLYDMPNSYIKFLINKLTGLDVSAYWVDRVTLAAFLLACSVSIYLNLKDHREKKKV